MSHRVHDLLDAFWRLSQDEQREAASVILRHVSDLEYPPLGDEALAQIADESFREYDAREAARDEG